MNKVKWTLARPEVLVPFKTLIVTVIRTFPQRFHDWMTILENYFEREMIRLSGKNCAFLDCNDVPQTDRIHRTSRSIMLYCRY